MDFDFSKNEPIPICKTSDVMEFENCCDVACEKSSSSFTFKSFISSFKLSIEYWIDWIEIESDLEIFLKDQIKVKVKSN